MLFRIAQEALANVREHARPSTRHVTLLERDGGHAVRDRRRRLRLRAPI